RTRGGRPGLPGQRAPGTAGRAGGPPPGAAPGPRPPLAAGAPRRRYDHGHVAAGDRRGHGRADDRPRLPPRPDPDDAGAAPHPVAGPLTGRPAPPPRDTSAAG